MASMRSGLTDERGSGIPAISAWAPRNSLGKGSESLRLGAAASPLPKIEMRLPGASGASEARLAALTIPPGWMTGAGSVERSDPVMATVARIRSSGISAVTGYRDSASRGIPRLPGSAPASIAQPGEGDRRIAVGERGNYRAAGHGSAAIVEDAHLD